MLSKLAPCFSLNVGVAPSSPPVKAWRADGKAFDVGRPFGRDDRGRSSSFGGRDSRPRMAQREMGPAGHDYSRADGDDAQLPAPAADIDDMLARRIQAKRSTDFATADAIKDELRGLGIDVNDRIKVLSPSLESHFPPVVTIFLIKCY